MTSAANTNGISSEIEPLADGPQGVPASTASPTTLAPSEANALDPALPNPSFTPEENLNRIAQQLAVLKQGQDRLEGQLLGIVSLSTETQIQVTDIKGEWRAQQQQIKTYQKEIAAELSDMIEDRVHEAIFPDRQTKMVLLGVPGAASEDAKRKLTNILADVNCRVDPLYAYKKPRSARSDDQQQQQQQQAQQTHNIVFEVRPYDLPAIYRAKGELRNRGHNLQQQLHPKELQRKADLQKLPNFKAALAVELAKPPQARAIIWELDRCWMGKGEAATLWTLRRAQRWEAEETAAAAAAAAEAP